MCYALCTILIVPLITPRDGGDSTAIRRISELQLQLQIIWSLVTRLRVLVFEVIFSTLNSTYKILLYILI
jgi:hypothetical protein